MKTYKHAYWFGTRNIYFQSHKHKKINYLHTVYYILVLCFLYLCNMY